MYGIICLLLPDAGQPYTDMRKKRSPVKKIPLRERFARHWQPFLFCHADIINMILEHTAANSVSLNAELAK